MFAELDKVFPVRLLINQVRRRATVDPFPSSSLPPQAPPPDAHLRVSLEFAIADQRALPVRRCPTHQTADPERR